MCAALAQYSTGAQRRINIAIIHSNPTCLQLTISAPSPQPKREPFFSRHAVLVS